MISLDRNECRATEELRRMARDEAWSSTSWRYIATRLAARYGHVVAWLADDTMVEFSLESERVHRKTHRPNSWRFAS